MAEQDKEKSVLAEELVNCIETALSSYGESTSQVIFANFQTKYQLGKRDVLTKMPEFEDLLSDIFGRGVASNLLKKSILTEFANRFHLGDIDKLAAREDSLTAAVKLITSEHSAGS